MGLRVGCLLGGRACAWHSDVLAELPREYQPTVIGSSAGRFPTADIATPYLELPWENEVGPLPLRRLKNLRWRLTHRFGHDFRLAPEAGLLEGFDLLHTFELFTEWTRVALVAAARSGAPVLVSVWDTIAGHHAGCPRRGPVRRRALAEAYGFIVPSGRAEAALVLDGVGRERIFRVPPAVDPRRFHPGDMAARRELGAGDGDVLVLAVARLVPEKGVKTVLEALALALPAARRLRLAVVGSGPEAAGLNQRARELGLDPAVRFLGERPYRELPGLYRAADVFVLASLPTPDWEEQWGQSLLEAMASALACIGTFSGAIPEVLEETGLLVPPGDPPALASALVRLAEDQGLRQTLGKSARTRVERRFDQREAARLLAQVYGKALGPGPRP